VYLAHEEESSRNIKKRKEGRNGEAKKNRKYKRRIQCFIQG
jgi:hypothetical protein